MANFTLKINGASQSVDVEDDTPLLWVLRDHLNLVGTKFSCGIAQCGACTVHINGTATFSCVTPISSVGNSEVTTIEGLSKDGDHPVQKAWEEVDVAQCGYCQSGQIMTAAAFLEQNPSPTLEEIDNAMNRNICRCGTYGRIRSAIKSAAGVKA